MEEQADQASELVAPAPTEWGKGLRCCVPCHLVKTFEQFYEEGCQNCPFLGMEGDRERIYDATTTDFHVSFQDRARLRCRPDRPRLIVP